MKGLIVLVLKQKALTGLALVAWGVLILIIPIICTKSINLIAVYVCMALTILGVVLIFSEILRRK